MVSSHPSEPMVNERGLSDPSPGNDCNDVDILVCPCPIQKSDILFSTKNITSGDRQFGYGNLVRSKSCWRLAGSDTRSGRGRLQDALASDSTPCVDCACYRRHRLQQLVRNLETLCRILLKEFLKENYDRLWNIFESLRVRVDADTSPQRKDLGTVFGQSPLPRALRQASTDPTGCQRLRPQIARDWQTLASRQMPRAIKSQLQKPIRLVSSPGRGR